MPAASLITTKDRLVRPRKQRALAAALGASTVLAADHSAPWDKPGQFSSLTIELVSDVVARSALTDSLINVAT